MVKAKTTDPEIEFSAKMKGVENWKD